MKYLPLYYRWMKTGRLPKDGLCRCFPDDSFLNLITPGPEIRSVMYWGYRGEDISDDYFYALNRLYEFSPLRQNIVLLMAAMAGELD